MSNPRFRCPAIFSRSFSIPSNVKQHCVGIQKTTDWRLLSNRIKVDIHSQFTTFKLIVKVQKIK